MSGTRSSLSSILFKRVGLRSALLTPRKESSTCLSDPREISQDEPQENRIDHTLKSPRRKVCQPVLDHFDAQYTAELGSLWTSVRSVLLNPGCWQYGVMMNRFADVQELRTRLLELGYCSLLPQRDTTPVEPYVPPSHSPHGGSLECYVQRGPVRLPAPRHEPGYLKRYFLLNAASLLPVLALGVTENERVLDMCSAPGGKAVAILQTTCPGFLHCNEVDRHRCDWLSKTLESYVPTDVMKMLRVTNQDGRDFGQTHQAAYDKVLVDAPCSNDRSWLFSPSELRGHQWLKERQKLPALQTQLLRSALAAVRPGGVVVYSTCTLSQAENQQVVEGVLATCPWVEAEDLQEELLLLANPLSEHFVFAPPPPAPLWPPGLLVVPERIGHTWGPMYLCRLRRTR